MGIMKDSDLVRDRIFTTYSYLILVAALVLPDRLTLPLEFRVRKDQRHASHKTCLLCSIHSLRVGSLQLYKMSF